MKEMRSNPFRFGALALDESFADREGERDELCSDIRNGQDVVVFAPRRFGKSSLAWSAARAAAADGVLVAQVDLMTTPTKERLAAALAESIYTQIASILERAREKALAPFRDLRVQPTVTVDPTNGSFSFAFRAEQGGADIDATLERLIQLPAELGVARGRRTALIMDEFQEIVEIDPGLPNLLRAVFQQQPEVAHVYLGSKRHVMARIFSDENEPFWRSAKSIELGLIEREPFAHFITARFEVTGKAIDGEALGELLARTDGHPYATQELCYFLWEQTSEGEEASVEQLQQALTAVLRSEHAHFSLLWDEASTAQKLVLQALANEPGRPYKADYRVRHALPPATNVQRALRSLEQREIVKGEEGAYRIVEPFLAEWLRS
jgi:AAA+ ATPase superfamily predicted ATPase